MNRITESLKKTAAGALCALLLCPHAASAAGNRAAPTPKTVPELRAAPARLVPSGPAAPQVKLPESVLKAMGYQPAAPSASLHHDASLPGAVPAVARVASPEKLSEVADALSAAPKDMDKASGEDAQGSGRKLEQAMTGERQAAEDGAVTAEIPAQPSLAQASAWGKGVVDRVMGEFAKDIVGYERPIQTMLIALIAGKNINFVALPGTAKTKMVRILGVVTGAQYKRIQFTSDMMPSDVTGGFVRKLDPATQQEEWVFEPGPVFTQILHADEINRAQPKAQSALLEAMQEKAVSAGGVTRPLDPNFFVAATMNPVEQDGTYRLPEAQLDRFLGQEVVGIGNESETLEVIKRNEAGDKITASQVTDMTEVLALRELSRALPMDDRVRLYATRLSRATHDDPVLSQRVKPAVGPARAAIDMVVAARVLAVLKGQSYVSAQEVFEVAHMVLRHRIAMLDPEDDKEAFIWEILNSVQTPGERDLEQARGQARLAKPSGEARRPMRPAPVSPRVLVSAPMPGKSWWKPWTWFR